VAVKVSMYWKKATRMPGEGLKEFAAEIGKLNEQDKKDLDEWSRLEMTMGGMDILPEDAQVK
jgi:hypothetical protein